jgi:hypothetical protein
MPVIALPPDASGCCPSGCASITPISPVVTVTDSGECLAEPMAVRCYQGAIVDLAWVFRDNLGAPVDLTGCRISSVQFRMQEIVCRHALVVDAACSINNKVPGGVKITLPVDTTAKPGVFEIQFGLSIDSGDGEQLRHVNRGYIIIESSMFSADPGNGDIGPPSVDDILMTVQMGDPARSDLLRRKEWNLAEIAISIAKPVEYWNTALPPIGVYYSTTNFPFRWDWREGIIASLMLTAASGYLRDHMVYQSSGPGSAFDDKAKWDEYFKIGTAKWQTFTEMVLAQKGAYNMRNGYSFAGTPYTLLTGY